MLGVKIDVVPNVTVVTERLVVQPKVYLVLLSLYLLAENVEVNRLDKDVVPLAIHFVGIKPCVTEGHIGKPLAVRLVTNEAFEDDSYVRDYIELFTKPCYGRKEVVELGINWSAIGTVSPEKAEAFGKALVDASEVCKNFKYNGYEITYKS